MESKTEISAVSCIRKQSNGDKKIRTEIEGVRDEETCINDGGFIVTLPAKISIAAHKTNLKLKEKVESMSLMKRKRGCRPQPCANTTSPLEPLKVPAGRRDRQWAGPCGR
jgi:hypothetical protein